MNYLELCQAVERKSGTVATSGVIASVASVSGRQIKVAEFVRDAWLEIQRARTDWLFLVKTGQFSLTAGTATYDTTTITDFGRWAKSTPYFEPFTIYDPAVGRSDENVLHEIPWVRWRERYDRGVPPQNRPHEYAIGPAQEFCVGAIPDKTYTIRGEYRKAVQRLTLDADEPSIPEEHHLAIEHKALMLLAAHDEAPVLAASADKDYRIAFKALADDQVGTGAIGLDGQIN